MALSLTFPPPALQSGTIADLGDSHMHSWPQEGESDSSDQTSLILTFFQAVVWIWKAFFTADRGQCGHSEQLAAPQPHRLQAVVLRVSWDLPPPREPSGSVLRQSSGQASQRRGWVDTDSAVLAYLSQVDVNRVLQELRRLPGPLLNGQHAHSFHTGLQLNHPGILILLQTGNQSKEGRPVKGLSNQRQCFLFH